MEKPTAGPRPHPEPLISVLIPFKNEAPTLPLILDSLLNQQVDFPFEVIFADGCSTDNSVEVIQKHPLSQKVSVQVLPLPLENHGMVVGWNTAAAQAKGKIFIFSQSDIRVRDPKALVKVAKAFESPDVAGTTYVARHSDAEFHRYDFWGQVFQSHHLGWSMPGVYDEKFNGARRDAFEKMKGFDAVRFAWGGESMDFLARLREQGKIFDTDIEAEHIHALGKKHTAIGLLKKHARNAEVMGANLFVHGSNRDLDPGFVSELLKRLVVCLICIAALIPFTWPWSLGLLLLLGIYWNKSAFLHIRNWRLIYVPFFGVAGLYYFTWFFLQGIVLRRTAFKFDNTMR